MMKVAISRSLYVQATCQLFVYFVSNANAAIANAAGWKTSDAAAVARLPNCMCLLLCVSACVCVCVCLCLCLSMCDYVKGSSTLSCGKQRGSVHSNGTEDTGFK